MTYKTPPPGVNGKNPDLAAPWVAWWQPRQANQPAPLHFAALPSGIFFLKLQWQALAPSLQRFRSSVYIAFYILRFGGLAAPARARRDATHQPARVSGAPHWSSGLWMGSLTPGPPAPRPTRRRSSPLLISHNNDIDSLLFLRQSAGPSCVMPEQVTELWWPPVIGIRLFSFHALCLPIVRARAGGLVVSLV